MFFWLSIGLLLVVSFYLQRRKLAEPPTTVPLPPPQTPSPKCHHGVQHRKVHLPLRRLDKCAACGSAVRQDDGGKLKLCASCGERIYCSGACQKKDWSKHKARCGPTDRIDISTFHPFLAFLADKLRTAAPTHFALEGELQNLGSVSSWAPRRMPCGWTGRLLVIDDTKTWDELHRVDPGNPQNWWPGAPSYADAAKLMFRVMRQGNVLPVLTALSLALLAEVYTTPAESDSAAPRRRVRLGYRSSPIADFGIAKGSVRVAPQDRLAYQRRSDGSFAHGQDPDEHYWLYFTTITGEELVLDVSMFTFNLCLYVDTAPYVSPAEHRVVPRAPVLFADRAMRRRTPAAALHTERRRVSVLRNKKLHKAVEHTRVSLYDCDVNVIRKFMEGLLERPLTDQEEELTGGWIMQCCVELAENLKEERWKTYPASPPEGVHADPGQMEDLLQDFEMPDLGDHRRRRRRR